MLYNYKERHQQEDKAVITTGPFLVPLETDCEYQVGRENERIIIIISNPTGRKLKASVKLGVCVQPYTPALKKGGICVIKNLPEKEFNLGTFELKPHTCTRIESDIPEVCSLGSNEGNAVVRIVAKGDFLLCGHDCKPACGLLEISVVGGSIYNPGVPGLEQADPVTLFRYHDFVVCEGEDCWC